VDVDVERALAFAHRVVLPRLDEFRGRFPTVGSGDAFHLVNGSFMAGDAHVYYAVLREQRPRRVVEVGAGRSTQVAVAAMAANRAEGHDATLTAIDPSPPSYIASALVERDQLLVAKVQDVDIDLLTGLERGDVFFIDSSHLVRGGGDVLFQLCEVVARLKPGVFVHFHDISLPKPYPRTYFEQGLYWAEQYVLQTFLAFNSKFEIVWPATYLMVHHREFMETTFPELQAMRAAFPLAEPSSFWIRVRDDE
jgi:Methyltransferase domain